MKPCKHLDHNEATYGETCELKTLDGFSCPVKYWKRKLVPYEGAPENVQFCGKGRGRINGIFNCYNEGEMPCYEPKQRVQTLECPVCRTCHDLPLCPERK